MTDNKSKQTIEEEEDIIIVDSETEEEIISNDDIVIEDDEIEESSIIMIGNTSYNCNELISLVQNNYNTLDDESKKAIEQTNSRYVSSFIYCLFKTIYSKQSFERCLSFGTGVSWSHLEGVQCISGNIRPGPSNHMPDRGNRIY